MSKESHSEPRHAKHLAANPSDATFRVSHSHNNESSAGHAPAPAETAEQPDAAAPVSAADADEATVLMPPPQEDPEATRLVDAPVRTADHNGATPSASPAAPEAGEGATCLMSHDPAEEATRLAAVPNPADLPTTVATPAANEAARLAAVPSPANAPQVDEGATRLISPEEAGAGVSRPAATPEPPTDATRDEATRLIAPEGETNEVLFPEHDYPGSDRTFSSNAASAEDATNPEGVRLAKNEIAAIPVQHTGYSNDEATPYISKRQARKTPEQRHHTHKVVAIVVCVLILLGLAGGCLAFYHSFMTNTQEQDVPQYHTATIESGEFVDSVDGSTVLRPVQTQDIVPQVSGTVDSVKVENGSTVAKGDVLFTLSNQTITDEATKAKQAADQAQQDVDAKTKDQSDAQQALDTANKAVADTQTSIEQLLGIEAGTLAALDTQEQAETDPANPSDTLKTLQKTVDDAEAKLADADKSKLTDLQTQLQQAKDQVTEAQAKVDSTKAALDTANENLTTLKDASDKAADQVNKLTVTAPFAGTVSNLADSAAAGSEVTGSTTLCTVNDDSQYIVMASVPSNKINQVSVGQTARLTFPDLPDLGTIEASVTKIGDTPSTSGNTTVYPVTITITDPDSSLQDGTAVQSSIILQSVPDSLIVPLEAVQKGDDGNQYLDVLLDPTRGIHTMIQVNVKASSDTQAAVESPNIQADTQVILPDE